MTYKSIQARARRWVENNIMEFAFIVFIVCLIIFLIGFFLDIKNAGGLRQLIVEAGREVISVYEEIKR